MRTQIFIPGMYFTIFFMLLVCGCHKNPLTANENTAAIDIPRPSPPPQPVPGACDYQLDEASLLNAGWVKTFEDNFDAGLGNWNTWYGGAYNNELQLYQAPNVTVASGNLIISAKAEKVTGPTTNYDGTIKSFNYTSGRIESIQTISSSSAAPKVRLSARIKLPAGYGMWPAFWSYGDPWPTQGEIDVLEARGQEDFKYQTNYFYGKVVNRNLVRGAEGYVSTGTSLQSCYHVYELVWSQNALQFYLDGVLVKTNTGGYVTSLFGKTEKIVLNLAVGGGFFSNLDTSLIVPGTMYVDWVKVYTSL
ncbi:MAG: glycoside hydrolase family 16 protein [Ferruginibacter sp.]